MGGLRRINVSSPGSMEKRRPKPKTVRAVYLRETSNRAVIMNLPP